MCVLRGDEIFFFPYIVVEVYRRTGTKSAVAAASTDEDLKVVSSIRVLQKVMIVKKFTLFKL